MKFSFLYKPKEYLKFPFDFAFTDVASNHPACHRGGSNREQIASLGKMKLIDLCVYCLEGKITVFVS